MSVYVDDSNQIIVYDNDDKKDITTTTTSRINKGGEPPTATMEAEKRIRREIANSNERRRMQSINNGFQSLRSLLPHHEGEKLSKAAILQQTAEYIYSLEQEKTRLLSQNCQLKRLVSQHESSINNNNSSNNGNNGELPPKKRKTEILLAPPPPPPPPPPLSTATTTTAAESSDEGLGSMSPEPIIGGGGGYTTIIESPAELRRQLERERNLRLVLEEQVRQIENQLFQQQQQSPQIYHVDNTDDLTLQLVTAESVPPVGHTQTVVCSPSNSRSPSPEPLEQQPQRLPAVLENAIKAEPKVEVERLPSPNPGHDETITTTATAATTTTTGSGTTQNRLYVANTSRQNLETIVEAIRHLEGDHMFGDEPAVVTTQRQQQQEVPLALTKHNPRMNRMEFSATIVQQSQQSRPGVIVVKQAS